MKTIYEKMEERLEELSTIEYENKDYSFGCIECANTCSGHCDNSCEGSCHYACEDNCSDTCEQRNHYL